MPDGSVDRTLMPAVIPYPSSHVGRRISSRDALPFLCRSREIIAAHVLRGAAHPPRIRHERKGADVCAAKLMAVTVPPHVQRCASAAPRLESLRVRFFGRPSRAPPFAAPHLGRSLQRPACTRVRAVVVASCCCGGQPRYCTSARRRRQTRARRSEKTTTRSRPEATARQPPVCL